METSTFDSNAALSFLLFKNELFEYATRHIIL